MTYPLALTDREAQVVALLRRGLSNKEIGNSLNISEGTVKLHVHRIFDKAGVRKRTALITGGDRPPHDDAGRLPIWQHNQARSRPSGRQ